MFKKLFSTLIFFSLIFTSILLGRQQPSEDTLIKPPTKEPTIKEKELLDKLDSEMTKIRELLNWRPSSWSYSSPSYSSEDSDSLQSLMSQLIKNGGEVAIYHAFKNMAEIGNLFVKSESYFKGKKDLTSSLHMATTMMKFILIGRNFISSFEEAVEDDKTGKYETNNLKFVIPWLIDKNSPMRSSVATILGFFKSKESVQALIEVLDDDNVSVREESIKSLAIIGDSTAVKPLTDKLNDNSTKVQYAAAISIYKLKGKEFENIIKPVKEKMRSDLKNKDTKLRIQAIESLAELKAIDMLEELRKVANEDSDEKVRNKAKEKIEELEQIRR